MAQCVIIGAGARCRDHRSREGCGSADLLYNPDRKAKQCRLPYGPLRRRRAEGYWVTDREDQIRSFQQLQRSSSLWARIVRREIEWEDPPYPQSVLATIYRDMTAEEKTSEARMAKASAVQILDGLKIRALFPVLHSSHVRG